jgi:DNA-directed RNA polymerase specialized sigma subunit
MRIANHLISWKVSAYKKSKDNLPEFDDRDAGDIYELSETSDCPDDVTEDTVTELTRLAYEVSKDDDNLSYFTMRYFEKADFKTIALEMGLSVEQVYVLRKKLVRRLLPFKNELID